MYDIIVICHEHDDFENNQRTISVIGQRYQNNKINLLFQSGIIEGVQAKVAVNHVNLTKTPPEYIEYFKRFPKVINGALTDISKSRVCAAINLDKTDNYDGPVIVKTDLNYGGRPERSKIRKSGFFSSERLSYLLGKLRLGLANSRFLDPNDYPIFEHSSEVPEQIWSNPHLVVQKCLTERDAQGRYCLRSWYVLGDCGFHVMTVANHPVVKGKNILDRWVLREKTPPALESMRQRLGMDFGRMDYAIVEGEVALFDVNRTPTNTEAAIARYPEEWLAMSQGLLDYL